ncbi:MAG: ATP-binding cassette domain-containing protein [Candidatus Ancillula trichonymphae]|jgi:putative ABC transport system ATP-binding protein|nr:ATP-binding cassette domain-containing protein [Candidatus Ancillula trichonymphae]
MIRSLKLQNISKSFGDHLLWSNISLDLSSKDFVILTGKSGDGKTTLLNCLGLTENVSSGKIFYDKSDVSKLSSAKKIKYYKSDVSFVFQNYGLLENETVADNLLLTLFLGTPGRKKEKVDATVKALTKLGVENLLHKKVYSLSGGEQQRVSIARAILKNPSLIISMSPHLLLMMQTLPIQLTFLKNWRTMERL